MVKAEEKKKNNISEYIIHLYQSEDLIRSYQFDLNKINTYIISHIPLDGSGKKELLLWYASIIEAMQKEGIEKKGHLKETENLIAQLLQLHNKLKNQDTSYKKIASTAEPYIQNQVTESNNTIHNPIQICLNAIYGFLLLKLNGQSVTNEQQAMLDTFGDLLSFLSYKFKQDQFLTSN